jgi:hypothetical protein
MGTCDVPLLVLILTHSRASRNCSRLERFVLAANQEPALIFEKMFQLWSN